MPLTKAQIDALKAAHQSEGALIDALVPDSEPPPPPPPPPPATGDVILTGNAILNRQWAVGPADRANLGKLQELQSAIPAWDIFANAEEQFAPSLNGAEAVSPWIQCHVYGNRQGLYVGCPRLYPDGLVRNVGSKLGGDSLALNLVPGLKKQPLKPGPRGQNCGTPFGAVRSHSRRVFNQDGTSFLSMDPNIPHFIKVDIHGNIWYYMRSGELRLPFTLSDVGGIFDWCPVPSSRKEMLVADNLKGCVWHLLRSGTTFTQTKFCDLPGVTSVISLPDGRHFATGPAGIYEIMKGFTSLILSMANAFYLDYFTNGNLCVGTLASGLYRVDVGQGIAGVINAAGIPNQSWVWVAVDRNGTCGRKDTVYFGGSHFGVNDNIFVYKAGAGPAISGLVYFRIAGPTRQDPGQTTVGNSLSGVDIMGHYPWSGVPHEDDSCFFIEGESDGQPTLLVRDVGQFAPEDVYDHAAFVEGIYIIQYGVDKSQPIGLFPTLTCQMTRQGWSGIGVCADVIAQWPFAEQVSFVQKGLAGSFPRPFLRGRSVYNLLYVINRSSIRFLKEGKTLMKGLKDFCLPTFGQELPPLVPPPYLGVPGSDVYVEVAPATGKIQFLDNAGNVKPFPTGLTIDVYIDEGLPEQQVIRNVGSGVITIPLNKGQHSIRPIVRNGGQNYWGRATVVSV